MAEIPPGRRSLRNDMPLVAEFIDEMRTAFGADAINQSIRNGMKGGRDFYACENGHEIGSRDERVGIPLSQCQLTKIDPSCEAASPKNARRGK